MNCHEFEVRLEKLLDGQLGPAERDRCLQHADTCPVCAELLAAVRDPGLDTEDSARESLIQSVLAGTVGSACGQARQDLPAFVDQELESTKRDLLTLHLDNCPHCRQLESILLQLHRELPALAEAPVDDLFVRQVLAATLPRRTRVERWWRSHSALWAHRPRFAMEAAYVGLLVVMMVLGAFSTPVAALPQKGVQWLQPEPDKPSLWAHAQESLGTFWSRYASLFEKVEEETTTTEESP